MIRDARVSQYGAEISLSRFRNSLSLRDRMDQKLGAHLRWKAATRTRHCYNADLVGSGWRLNARPPPRRVPLTYARSWHAALADSATLCLSSCESESSPGDHISDGRRWNGHMGFNLWLFLRRTPHVVLRGYFNTMGVAVAETVDLEAPAPAPRRAVSAVER